MVAGKLLVAPIRPGEGVLSTLLLGSGMLPGDASWAMRGAKRMAGSSRGRKRVKVPPKKAEELLASAGGKGKSVGVGAVCFECGAGDEIRRVCRFETSPWRRW